MAALGKLLKGLKRHARFDGDVAARRRFLREARGFERRLNVHSVVDHVGNELRVRQRLIGSAHDAEPDVHIAALHECGNDGLESGLCLPPLRAR